MIDEIWKDITDYDGYYQVSSNGRVRSLDVFVNSSVQKNGKRLKRGKLISVVNGGYKGKYKVVVLNKNNTHKLSLVHRLVAKEFVDNPNNLKTVDHLDGNQSNNHYSNLEWCSGKENTNRYWLSNKKLRGVSTHRKTGLFRARINIENIAIDNYHKAKEDAYLSYYNTFKEWYGVEPFDKKLIYKQAQ